MEHLRTITASRDHMTRCRRLLALLVPPLLLTACSDATSPGERTLRVGRYSYNASHGANRGFVARSYSGTMTIESASPDSVRARFSVPNILATPAWHPWQVDAYRVVADPDTPGDIVTRLTRDGDSVRCDGSRAYIGPSGLESITVVCTVTYLGP